MDVMGWGDFDWSSVGNTGMSPEWQRRLAARTEAVIRRFLEERPDVRERFVSWLERGIAWLFRCPVCVRAGDRGDMDLRSERVHTPDGAVVDPSDRIAFYRLCKVHERDPSDPRAVEAVRWWATLDGDTKHPGRIVVLPPDVAKWSGSG